MFQVTPNYESTYVFENDFCALLETGPEPGTVDTISTLAIKCGRPFITCYHDLLETRPQLGTVGISTDYVIIINHGKPFIIC